MKTFRDILIILAVIFALFVVWQKVPRRTAIEYLPADTVIRVDTVRDTLRIPKKIYLARVDTVWLEVPADTIKVQVLVPIERKTYQTDDYKAEIEGFRASLVSMEVYPKTTIITRTEVRKEPTRPKWGIGIQAGCGIPINGRPAPYVGIGVQYNVLTW